MGILRVKTNLPCLKLTVYHGFTPVIDCAAVSTSAATPSGSDNFGQSQDKDFELPKGIYSARLSLPYCNPGDLKEFETGQMFYMPVVMEKTFIIRKEDDFVELNLLAHCEVKKQNDA